MPMRIVWNGVKHFRFGHCRCNDELMYRHYLDLGFIRIQWGKAAGKEKA